MYTVPFSYQIVAILAAIAFFVPLAIVFLRRMFNPRAFIWLTAYWAVGGIVNLLLMMETIADRDVAIMIERVYNLASAPFTLFILYKAVQIEKIHNSIRKMLPAFLCTIFLITLITRLEFPAEVLMVGGGLIVVLVYILWIIGYFMKGTKLQPTDQSLQYICFALLFEYGVSIITFVFNYIVPDQRDVQDSFLIYHLSIIIATGVASYGLLSFKAPRSKPQNVAREKKPEREAEIRFL